MEKEDLIQNSLINIVEGNYHMAIDQLTKIIEKDDKNYKAIFYRGIGHLNRGGYESALKDFTEAEKLRPAEEEDEFYYLKGKANYLLENLEEAKADLTKALGLKGLNENAKTKINKLLERINSN
ncbi:MAG: hypothetical protein MJ252_26260 [archaeon]|nr:hypothetical protein [archaeon]